MELQAPERVKKAWAHIVIHGSCKSGNAILYSW
jgi:hypothetical protein